MPGIGQDITLTSDQTHHLRDTLRLEVGDPCLVIDAGGREAEARVRSFSNGGCAQLTLEKERPATDGSSRLKCHAYVALGQRGKFDTLVEKAQELGLTALHPMETQRTMTRMTAEKKEKALARWEKIAREAAKQSGRPRAVIGRERTFIKELIRETIG